jgi:excinuclease ABC subunit B
MAETLTDYLSEHGVDVTYIHSDTETLDRIEIIRGLKAGDFDVLVGINLLREGLDIPECAFVAILDADKEGFLRSKTALVQTIGRAARNTESQVILYADTVTKAMSGALSETERRRRVQMEFNEKHGITPKSIVKHPKKTISAAGSLPTRKKRRTPNDLRELEKKIALLEKKMLEASDNLQFETAMKYRDEIKKLKTS